MIFSVATPSNAVTLVQVKTGTSGIQIYDDLSAAFWKDYREGEAVPLANP